ncbi:2614_t:CDS:2 [Scutellospora calospora]|uniref:2614_t:CDS:1 n=1 Tax=Scutellospora calospora TaxID=85575 RepID=A0ACA9K3X8_9GLOM|nr:2614_t:CDS:2 [Scutellospora calospora]
MAAPVGILRNASHAQQSKSSNFITTFSDNSDSEQEGNNSTDYGPEYETEPEGDLNTEEAQETLQHETLIKAGYLAKKQGKKVGNKNWKRRWFVLRSTKLAYYKSDKEYELLRILDLNDIHAVAEVKWKNNRTNVFGIVTPKRAYYVQAGSKRELDEWVDAINKVKKEVQDNEDDEGSQADGEDMVTKGKKSTNKRLTAQFKHKSSAPILDKQTPKSPVKETSAIDIPNSQVRTTEHSEIGNSYASISSFTSGGSIPNISPSPSSPVNANFVPERKDSSDPTASSDEEEGGFADATGEDNTNDGRAIQKGYLYKLDRYKDNRPQLNLNLSDILDAIETDSVSKSRQHCFKIITPKRTYVCCAPNEKSQVAWLAALHVALTKTKEKLKGAES